MIIDHIRDLEEFKEFYCDYPMPKRYRFKWLINNPNLFCVYSEDDGRLLGYITVQRESGYLTLSGASVRKNMLENLKFIDMVCEAFPEDMYAFTKVKPAIVLLRRAGFKHIKKDMYVRPYNKPKEMLFNPTLNAD